MAANLPSLVAALLVVIAGWFLARLARRGARRSAEFANRLLERALRRGSAAGVRISLAFTTVTGEIAFWLVLILALVLAAGVVGIGSIGQWLNQLVVHLPSVIIGASILVVGYFASVYLREFVASSAEAAELRTAGLLGRLAQLAVLAIALIIGLDQAGIEVAILLIAFVIILGGAVFGVVASFAAGSGTFVSNLIAARNARHVLLPGMRLRVDDVEGELLEISRTHVAVETDEGRVLLPAHRLETGRVLILTAAPERGADREEVGRDGG
ncbi:mechanosensitive ion channel family protein [Lentisalinibacter salinarum]|uniref:mechanosensitive ion channel family protein n=1 Tax=Lentisalinibacter salinarum TaxID=2992239 RepID=UPI003864F095